MKVVISGGGTGGHVFPAIAIADAIKSKQPEAEILFIGANGKIEMERVPKAGYRIEGLKISGFQRRLTFQNLFFPFRLLGSLWKARQILKKFKPDVVVGVGGYASGPTLQMATRLGYPTLIQEQNSFPGVTNRILAAKVDKICVAYDGMERFFPKGKILLTGNPVRNDLVDCGKQRDAALDYFKFDRHKKTIVVMGGSLGARTINEAMKSGNDFLKNHLDIQVLWQAGKIYIDEFSKTETAQLPNVRITAFIDRVDYAYAMADLIIARAGALTISELCVVAKPPVLVPSPNVAEDHQTKNALALVEKGAAVMVKDADAISQLWPVTFAMIKDAQKLETMSEMIGRLGRPAAAQSIAEEVLRLASKK